MFVTQMPNYFFSSVLSGPHRKVEKLRTTTPLFRAYEEVFVRLEKRCQVFFKSEQARNRKK